MPPKGSSLASLLGTLTNAAPVDFDPEALDADQPVPSTTADESDAASESHDDDNDDDDVEEEEDYMNPRAHYGDVGPSEMRKRAALSESDKMKDARYQGVKSSRAELYGGDDEEEEGDEEDDVTDDGSEDEDEDSEGENDISDEDDEEEEEEHDAHDATTKTKKKLRFAQDDDDDSVTTDEDDDDNDDEATTHASASASIAAQIAQSATQAKALKARRLEDAEKGRALRKQIKTYERTLETRIKAQSVLRDVNRLPDPTLYSDVLSTSPSTMEPAIGLLEQLLELSETLFSLRERLNALSHDQDDSGATSAPSTRKRKRDFDVTVPEDADEAARTWREITTHDQIEATLSDVVSFSRSAEPFRRSVLDKWSLKVTSAATSTNKFAPALRAVNQTPSAQIDSALAGDGESRLIARTRVLRDSDKLGHPTTTEEVRDEEVFDDSDFYSTLLKELIERRSSSSTSTPTTAAMMLSGMTGKKKKANVDTKASKGRKLRYEVNEKLVNFMPPIGDRLRWGEEQIERLFRQLASSSNAVEGGEGEGEGEGEEEEREEEAALDGLRVFG